MTDSTLNEMRRHQNYHTDVISSEDPRMLDTVAADYALAVAVAAATMLMLKPISVSMLCGMRLCLQV